MVSLIVFLVVLALVFWLITLIPVPEPFITIIKVIFVIVAILKVLDAFGLYTGFTLIH